MNYEELLKKAKEIYENEDTPHFFKAWLLANIIGPADESKDEKIRKTLIEYIKGIKSWNYFLGISKEQMIAWLEKQDKQPTDKVEPKFKVKDWVILNGIVAQILDKQKYGFVGLDIDGKDFFCNYGHTDSMRLWTINDANDGDVLCCESGWTCIFKALNSDISFSSYCFMDATGWFCETGSESHTLEKTFNNAYNGNIYPATKEQRELLFQKMKEAGYEWDFDKKELKKMEVASKESEDERIRKEIINFFELPHPQFVEERDQEKWLAWIEKQGNFKMIDSNKVIEWLNDQACLGWIEDVEVDKFINKFKKDFNL